MRRRISAAWLVVAVVGVLPACAATVPDVPTCGEPNNQSVLAAQSVPSATFIPCVGRLPNGWTIAGSRFERGSYTAWLDSDRAGIHALDVTLTRTCDVSAAIEIPTVDDPLGVRTFEEPIGLAPRFAANRYLTFPGGCLTYRFRFSQPASATVALEAQQAFHVVPRSTVRRSVAEIGLVLCGAGAPPCPG